MSLAVWQMPPNPAEDPIPSRSPTETAAYRAAAILNYGGAAIAGWLVFYSWPYALVFIAAAIAPLLGIALILNSGGYVRVSGDKKYPSLLFMFGLIPFSLAIATDKQRMIEAADVAPAIVFMLIATAIIAAIFPVLRKNLHELSIVAILTGFYGFGILSFINIQADTAPPQRLRTTVMDLSAPSRSRKNKFIYSMKVPEFEMLKITRSDFMTLEVGGPICVAVHPGRLGMRWVEVSRCA